jgi:NACHT domain
MLRVPEWRAWQTGTLRCLWIHGIPGAGKTMLASYLIEQLNDHCKQIPMISTGLIYYYCYFEHHQDETSSFLRWILCQLCRQAEVVPAQVYQLYKVGTEPSYVELLDALELILGRFELVYVVIDALDESNPRADLLKVVRDLSTDMRFVKIKILATSREYIDIEKTMEGISTGVSMSNPFVEEDIRTRIKSLLDSNPKFQRWPKHLLDEVESKISKGAKGM